MKPLEMMESTDACLVAESLAGSQEAFGRIVARYQTLVCSVAYSGTGSIGQSEDVAQETFVEAWRQLARLREPEKLRSWLCGIARNLSCDLLKKQGREPSHGAETLDAIREAPAAGPMSRDLAIGHEEAALLWHSLEQIPAMYREPLVLFYREHQSVEAVARSLDLTEDAVKQRLSRGRKLLHRQVLGFVEGALENTRPTKTFTLGVLAALSLTATPAKAATVGVAAAKAGAATKAGSALGPAAGFLPVLASLGFVVKSSLEYAKSPRERRFTVLFFAGLFLSQLIVITSLLQFLRTVTHDKFVVWAALFFIPLAFVLPLGVAFRVWRRQIRREDGTWEEPDPASAEKRDFFGRHQKGSKARMYFYLGLACNMGGLAIMQLLNAWHGERHHLLFLEFLLGFTLLLGVRAWGVRPR